MPDKDQKYIKALLDNDSVLMEELYQKYFGKISRMVLQNSGTEMDAADIFQEALLSIYHKAKTQNFVLVCPFEAFFYMVCRNKWLSELSKRKSSQVSIKDVEEYNTIGEDSFRLAEEFKLQQVRKALLEKKFAELGQGCQELLRLSWAGKSMEEVAAILKVSYGYARKKKSECLVKLITLIQHSSEFESLKW